MNSFLKQAISLSIEVHPPATQVVQEGRVSVAFAAWCLGATSVRVPNAEVKPSKAYGSARETVWEGRSLLGQR
jgi:hypothetical protein